MHSGLLASLGFAGLLLIAPPALAADPGCCSDQAQASQAADKGCCGDKAQAAPVAAKGCCGDKTPATHAAHAADKADKPQVAQASHSCCDMPCCKDQDHKNHVPAMAMLEADATAIFLMTMQTDPPTPPVVVARPGTPTIR